MEKTTRNTKPLFSLGQMVATPGAIDKLAEVGITPRDLLKRHIVGDWGDMSASDKRQNDAAIKNKDNRIFSAYIVNGVKFWVITEYDYSATTILLPEEY